MMHQRRQEYLSDSLRLHPREQQLITSFQDWLPDKIIDCHAHSNLPEHVIDMQPKTYQHMLSTFPSFSVAESEQCKKIFYPGKQVQTLRFPKTFAGIDHRAANAYLMAHSTTSDRMALFGLPEDVPYTNAMLQNPAVAALKMYYSYVTPTAERIYDFFLPDILEQAQSCGKPIILHLPKKINQCRDDLRQLIRDFPRLWIVLAHLGLSKFPEKGLREAMEEFAQYERVMMDTSLNPSTEVVSMALETFGVHKVMFGSDEPLNLIRAVAYEHPTKGQRIISSYPYHWIQEEDYRAYQHLASKAVHSHWSALEALRGGIKRIGETDHIKEQIFFHNAREVFAFSVE